MYPQYNGKKIEVHIYGFPPQSHSISLIRRKSSDKPTLRDVLENIHPLPLKLPKSSKTRNV
jgi:hypothetical protein